MTKAKYSPSTGGIYPTDAYAEFPEDALSIPDALYAKYQAGEIAGFRVTEGGKVVEFVPPAADPREFVTVTAFQAHAAIARAGLYDQVSQMMEAPDTPLEYRLAWTKAQEFRRLSPVVLAMAGPLGLSEQQLDDLFALAATIEA